MKALILSLTVLLTACGGGSDPQIQVCVKDDGPCVSSLPYKFSAESESVIFADITDEAEVARLTGEVNVWFRGVNK